MTDNTDSSMYPSGNTRNGYQEINQEAPPPPPPTYAADTSYQGYQGGYQGGYQNNNNDNAPLLASSPPPPSSPTTRGPSSAPPATMAPPPMTDLPPLVWKEISPSRWDDGPGDLAYYKTISVNNHIMLFGGVSDEFAASRGYDIIPTLTATKKDTCTGKSILRWNFRKATGDVPQERYGHTVTRVGSKVFLFGGRDPDSTQTFNDFYYLDLDIMVWKQIITPENQVPPTPRYDHTCTYINKRLFFIGGINSAINPAQYKSHVGIFNLESWEWEDSGSSAPSVSLAGHIAIPFASPTNETDRYILIFGGNSHIVDFSKPDFRHTSQHEYLKKAHIFKIDSKTWDTTDIPIQLDPTIHHAATWRPCSDGSLQVFIQGGFRDGSDLPNTMVVLRIDQRGYVWKQQQQLLYNILESPDLRHHNMVIAEDVLYLLGGLKDLNKQPSPYCLFCFQCTEILNYTTVFRIVLPEAD